MPKPNALIDGISGLTPPQKTLKALPFGELPKAVTVNFQGGRSGLLDMTVRRAAVWVKKLDFLQQNNMPAYVEIDPKTNIITQLLVPEVSRVRSLTPISEGDVEITLMPSPALYYLRSGSPDFEELRNALQSAKDNDSTVLVTWTRDKREIIDVRSLPEGLKDPLVPPETPPTPVDDPPVSPERARELFDLMNTRSCDPCTPAEPCIPFKYPSNGCHARAHEMCRLMIEEDEEPEKVWLYRSSPSRPLRVVTSNDPDCEVTWRYHVAPTLNVEISSGTVEKWVIDPSMFNSPVTVDEWINAQNNPDAIDEYSDASVYYKDQGVPVTLIDDDYSDTAITLELRRLDLEEQCAFYGPTPYSCPINKRCIFITDRSTFGEDEIAAMLVTSSPAVVESAFYVIVDAYSPQELGITSITPPNVEPDISKVPDVDGMSVSSASLAADYPDYLMRRQRLTWTFRIAFDNTNGFTEEVRSVALTASIACAWNPADNVSDTAIIYLVRQPNPYEIDGETSWLSTDLRVFQIREGESKFGETMGSTPVDASNLIKQVITNLNNGTVGGQTFEDNISTDLHTSWLELSEQVDGTRVFNFAVARVRYRGSTLDAQNVRVFFRLLPVSTTSLNYNQSTTYRRGGRTGVAIPLLGIRGGELVAIPCFAEPRIDSSTTDMNDQTDPANVRDIPHDATEAERYTYFGCWLDINQLQDQFPIEPFPTMDGPFAGDRRTIQELIRGQHQCLISEIAFDPNPIPDDATPSTSDKLAQRNLAIVESANPGDIASHRIPLTFDIQPTRAALEADEMADELMIDWGNTPDGSAATIYMPGISTAEVLILADEMYKVHRLSRIDEHTLQCPAGGITYVPIPPGVGANLAGLLTVDLPETVQRKQVFNIVVRQITDAEPPTIRSGPESSELTHAAARKITWRRILGSFQLTIPVSTKEVMLEPEKRLLSVLRWIQKAIPEDNRWYPVFCRYIGQIADRVDALGGDSTEVAPSPSGKWKDLKARLCKRLAFATGALLGISVVLLGVLSGGLLAPIGILVLALLIGVGCFWIIYCWPPECRLLRRLIAGVGCGAAVLALLAWLGVSTPQLITVLGISLGIIGIAALVGWVRRCL